MNFIKEKGQIYYSIKKEWLLIFSIVALVLTSIYIKRFPSLSIDDFEVIFLLWLFFIVVKGLENTGLISWASLVLSRGRFVPLKLVFATFILSSIITNDLALIIMIPISLALNISRKDILIITEAIAANAGSALTPFGNPQNLFIYWFYNIPLYDFVRVVWPIALILPVLLLITCLKNKCKTSDNPSRIKKLNKSWPLFLVFLLIIILVILRIVPLLVGIFIPVFIFFVDKKSFKVDYLLLFTFASFFGLSENIKTIIQGSIEHTSHIFILSATSSQIMGNVPAALLFSKFTSEWEALLWGVNVGGFGSLFASFANMIAYKFYVNSKHGDSNIKTFTINFMIFGYFIFALEFILYSFLGHQI